MVLFEIRNITSENYQQPYFTTDVKEAELKDYTKILFLKGL